MLGWSQYTGGLYPNLGCDVQIEGNSYDITNILASMLGEPPLLLATWHIIPDNKVSPAPRFGMQPGQGIRLCSPL